MPMENVTDTVEAAIQRLNQIDLQPVMRVENDGHLLCHVWGQREIAAIEVAIATRRPLLIRGEPGSGKSQIAKAAAYILGWMFHSFTVTPRTEPDDLIYRFDAVARLAEAHRGAVSLDPRDDLKYYEPGPLWLAFHWDSARLAGRKGEDNDSRRPSGHVVLIDEIDKADSDLPNSLLEIFGERTLRLPCEPYVVEVSQLLQTQPLVILTTNEDRELPAPFLRRCVVLTLETDPDSVDWLVSKRGCAYFSPVLNERVVRYMPHSVLEQAAELLVEERQQFKKTTFSPPGAAEYLDLLEALHTLRVAGNLDE